ncbi:DNA cytosine methyltransferase [Mesorhizobium sp. LSJC255A00]|uniref:DNA cytosine methyltransferase n=1 Tax=Mesorhizobium sp. LSJC255A00 TaxID=1287313 RepID=UPI000A05ABB5|nr:DNA cytosine methyltransferase [Mesorhizobium sp. LSJC255A00]
MDLLGRTNAAGIKLRRRLAVSLLSSPKIKVVDLFAGAGGFSLAAVQAGAEVVFAVEFDHNAAATYTKNIAKKGRSKDVVVYNDDITSLSASDLAERHFPKGKTCSVLLGGPPCQGFSSHRINGAGIADPRNALIHEYFKFVAELRPRAFLMENVPGMLWPRHRSYVEQFYGHAHAHKYTVFEPVKLDARDYGTPQRRQRVFILGLRQDVDATDFVWPPAPTHSSSDEDIAAGMKPWVPCTSAFEPAPADDPNDIHMNHGPELTAAFASTPPNGGSRSESGRRLQCHVNHDGHSDVYGRIDSSAPAPTMTTACINPSKGRFVHPTLDHGITARQAARVQTFPDDFVFEGGLMAAGRQIGNAVPIMLGEILIRHIQVLLSSEQNADRTDKGNIAQIMRAAE